ncbi:phosphoesterase PA-phosphatase [Polymorphospora rubra]|uniref:phosphoesterase PA-phosphatase n=1 Tax=Polymorphospora rubra TaxID=338584 RepID=UPI003F4D5801
MPAVTSPSGQARSARVAKLVTDVLSPAVLVAGLLLGVAWHSSPDPAQALKWGLIAAGAASFLPITYIIRGVRRGRWADAHVSVREHRSLPLLVCLLSTAVGAGCLYLAGAPRELLVLIGCMVAALAVAVPVTLLLRWKISLHALVAAGTAIALTVLVSPYFVATWPVAALVGWSRVRLRDHTLAQVLAGAATGVAATGVLLPALL